VQERSRCSPSLPPFPPWLILFPLRMPRRHVPFIVPCSCCPHAPFEISTTSLWALKWSAFPTNNHIKVLPALYDAHPPPLSSCLQRHRIIQAILQTVLLLSNSNQRWLRCHHKLATLVDLHFFVPLACHAWAIFLPGNGARTNRGGAHDGGALFEVGFCVEKYYSSVAGSGFLFVGSCH
jgi:hypothetical protein